MKIPRKLALFGTLAAVLIIASGLGAYLAFTNGFFDRSTARITEDNGSILVSFNIAKKDREKAAALSQDLGIDTSWEKGLNFGVDQGTLNNFKEDLPIDLFISFKGNEIAFQSNGMGTILESSLSGKDYTFATGSGSLKLTEADASHFSLHLDNPGDLVYGATSSGQIYISPEMKGLLELSNKVATMDLKVNSGNVTGDILFR